jgi:hypothetical protein
MMSIRVCVFIVFACVLVHSSCHAEELQTNVVRSRATASATIVSHADLQDMIVPEFTDEQGRKVCVL